jgi:hypothetical protein
MQPGKSWSLVQRPSCSHAQAEPEEAHLALLDAGQDWLQQRSEEAKVRRAPQPRCRTALIQARASGGLCKRGSLCCNCARVAPQGCLEAPQQPG